MASITEPEENQVAPLYQYPIIVPCDLCETEDEVNSFCRNCSQNLCESCKRLHLRSTVSRDHDVVHISEGKASKPEVTTCLKHGERLFFYCRSCCVLFCQKCLNPRHKNHDFLDSDEYAKEIQSKVALMVKKQSKRVNKSRENIKHIEERRKKYVDECNKCKASIIASAKYLHSEVDRVQAELLSSLTLHESQDLPKFELAVNEEKIVYDELQKSLDNLIRQSKMHDNISLVACSERIINNCQDSVQDIPSFCVTAVEFRETKNSKHAMSKLFGALQCNVVDVSRNYMTGNYENPSKVLQRFKDYKRQLEFPTPEQAEEVRICTCKGKAFYSPGDVCTSCKRPFSRN